MKEEKQMLNSKGKPLHINTQKLRVRINDLFSKVEPFSRPYVRSILIYFMAALDELDELRGDQPKDERLERIIQCRNSHPSPDVCVTCLDCIGEFDELEQTESEAGIR
jgi:hypothetical protein